MVLQDPLIFVVNLSLISSSNPLKFKEVSSSSILCKTSTIELFLIILFAATIPLVSIVGGNLKEITNVSTCLSIQSPLLC